MKAPSWVVEALREASTAQLERWKDDYADSFNWPMLSAVQNELWLRRQDERKWAA